MTSDRPPLHIGISIDGAGHHPAAWREPGAAPSTLFTADHVVSAAQEAERGLLDFVTLSDSFELQSARSDEVRGQLDALLSMARVAPVTSSIGLVATVTTTHTEPFHVSKNLATLDLVSNGRAGWLVDVSTTEAAARHFGRRSVATADELYAEASEAVDAVSRLWDSWEDDAVIRDVATGRYIDRDKLHYTDFEGRFFSVRGPSITPRSPQAQVPVVVHVVGDESLALAAERADIVLSDAADPAAAAVTRERIDAAVVAAGRHVAAVHVLAIVDVLLADTAEEAAATRARLDDRSPAPPSTLGVVGSPAALVELFDAWSPFARVDGFLIRPAVLGSTLQQLVDHVVPALQDRGLFRTRYDADTLRGHFGLVRPANRYATVGAEEPS